MDQNPYAAPQSRVESVFAPGTALLEHPVALPADAALSWLTKGWAMFRLAPLIWILMALLAGLGYVFVAFIPFGGFIVQILMPIVLASFYLGADRLNFGESLDVAQISAGFSRNPGPLAVVGILSGLIQLVVMLPLAFGMIMIGDQSGLLASGSTWSTALAGVALVMLLAMVLVSLATWFAPMLIAIDNLDVVHAIRLGWRGCRRNLAPILLLAAISILVLLGLVLTLGFGYLVVMPWYCCASYVAYRQIFFGD